MRGMRNLQNSQPTPEQTAYFSCVRAGLTAFRDKDYAAAAENWTQAKQFARDAGVPDGVLDEYIMIASEEARYQLEKQQRFRVSVG